MLLPSFGFRIYNHQQWDSPNVWIILINSFLCITGSFFQEAMVRRIKKKLGYYGLGFFILSLPLIFFNILFSDPAPYFTLCTYGCFSIEPCTTKDQNWGNVVSLSFVFACAFLLSANVLAIWFIVGFIRLGPEDINKVIIEVREKYAKSLDKQAQGKEEDSEDDQEPDKTKVRDNDEKGFYEIHSVKDPRETEEPVYGYHDGKLAKIGQKSSLHGIRAEFADVPISMRPIPYIKK